MLLNLKKQLYLAAVLSLLSSCDGDSKTSNSEETSGNALVSPKENAIVAPKDAVRFPEYEKYIEKPLIAESTIAKSDEPAPAPVVYTECAKEGESIKIDVGQKIYYGLEGKYNSKQMDAGTINCDNATFGDAFHGRTKKCFVEESGSCFTRN